jgi:putative membrane protein
MFLALCGALVSQLFFARAHERQIGRLRALTIDTL